MKISSRVPSTAAVCLLATAFLATAAVAQAPQNPPEAGAAPSAEHQAGERPGGMPRKFPPPKNLKVLPKNLTGAQVRDIMHHWAGDLGQECSACHAAYPNRVDEHGRPVLNFPSDEKAQKRMARIMYTMVQLDKKKYVSKVKAMDTMDSPAPPLTCGTCHRGHLDPEEYVPPRRGPRPGGAPAGGPPAPHGK